MHNSEIFFQNEESELTIETIVQFKIWFKPLQPLHAPLFTLSHAAVSLAKRWIDIGLNIQYALH